MAYSKTYTHEDKEAFFKKDLLIVKQTCLNAIASIHHGEHGTAPESLIKEAESLLSFFYPNGTAYHCEDMACQICNKDAVPFADSKVFKKNE